MIRNFMILMVCIISILQTNGQLAQPEFLSLELNNLISFSDIDLDGDLDIFASPSGWAERNSIGHYQNRFLFTDDAEFNFRFVIDVDNDGDDDALGLQNGEIGWYENDHSTQLWAWHSLFPGEIPYLLDFNSDGTWDIVYELGENNWTGRINENFESFSEEISLADNSAINLLNCFRGDLDMDGLEDGVRIECPENEPNCPAASQHYVYFLSSENYVSISGSTANGRIAYIGDINGNGIPDAVSNTESGYVNYYLYIDPALNGFSDPLLLFEEELVFGRFFDYDNDGDIDVFGWDQNGINGVILYLNDGLGNYSVQDISEPTDYGLAIDSALLGDVDGDGDIDMQIQESCFINEGNFTISINSPNDLIFSQPLIRADIDGNGKEEIISSFNNIIFFSEELHIESIVPFPTFTESYSPLQNYHNHHVQDWNNDGLDDLILVIKNTFQNELLMNILLSNGSELTIAYSEEFTLDDNWIFDDQFVDIDGNGLFDYVFAYQDGSIHAIFSYLESQFSTLTQLCDFEDTYHPLRFIDYDHDGDADIFNVESDVEWFRNDGENGFTSIPIDDPDEFIYPTLEWNIDINGDGILDLIPLDLSVIVENDGFQVVENYFPNITVSGPIIWINLNGDEKIDLVILQNADDEDVSNNILETYINTSGFEFMLYSSIPVESNFNIIPITAIDANGDGLEELFWASLYGPWDMFIDYNTIQLTSGLSFISLNNFEKQKFISGHIFQDENGDGIWSPDETGIGMIPLSLTPDGSIEYPGDYFSYNVQSNTYEVSVAYDDEVWTPTTPTVYYIEISDSNPNFTNVDFGFQTLNAYAVNTLIESNPSVCSGIQHLDLFISNVGENTLQTVISLTLDSLLSFQSSSITPDSISGQNVYWTTDYLNYGTSETIDIYVNYPSAEFIGQELITLIETCSIYDQGNIQSCDHDTLSEIITCSYDPNFIEVFPDGWTSSAFILNDTELEYTIHFQNTGSAPAQNVSISNQLPPEHNWQTLQPTAWSHEISHMNIDSDGILHVYFDDIMLPDSTSDEANSHGFFQYSIQLNENLDFWTEIHNSAQIFFDLNDPIQTNTTLNTIYSCEDLTQVTINSFEICAGESLFAENVASWLENVSWNYNSDSVSISNPGQITILEDGVLSMNASNHLCSISQDWNVDVILFAAVIEQSGWYILEANDGVAYQWYFQGLPIQGATEQTLNFLEYGDGFYSVLVTDEHGCIDLSQEDHFYISSVNVNSRLPFLLTPNPANIAFRIENLSSNKSDEVIIRDVTGRLIHRQSIYGTSVHIECSDWQPGVYVVNVGSAHSTLVIE